MNVATAHRYAPAGPEKIFRVLAIFNPLTQVQLLRAAKDVGFLGAVIGMGSVPCLAFIDQRADKTPPALEVLQNRIDAEFPTVSLKVSLLKVYEDSSETLPPNYLTPLWDALGDWWNGK